MSPAKRKKMGTTKHCHWCPMPVSEYGTKKCQFCNITVSICVLCEGEEWDSFEHLSMCANDECDNCEPLCENEAAVCPKCNRAFFCSTCMIQGVCPNCLQLNYIENRPTFNDSYLKQLHPCPEFDPYIEFDEPRHVYSVDGEEWKGSVTGFVHTYFPEFDEDACIQRMMSSANWEMNKYYGMTADEIKALWKEIRDTAAASGTEMHAYIEYYYNASNDIEREVIINEYHTLEFSYFLNFHNNEVKHLKPWRTELRVFDRELLLAGSVDMLYISPRSTESQPLLIMYDWKRSKDILNDRAYGRGKGPVSHILNTKTAGYNLQLNVYKAIIERNSSWRIESMWLGVFHPTQKNYITLRVPDLSGEVAAMFKLRQLDIEPDAHDPSFMKLINC